MTIREWVARHHDALAVSVVVVALVGAVTTYQVQRSGDLERSSGAERALVAQTLGGCQRGNELRRAVLQIAEVQENRALLDPAVDPPILDRDAFTITPCRETVIRITGADPGPVPNFVP